MVVTELLTGGIAVTGLGFLGLMANAAFKMDGNSRLARHRDKGKGFADFLNYAAVVDDGVIVQKSGALMAAWVYRGPDNASASVEEREMVAARINQALRGLGAGWMLHVDCIRVASPGYPAADASAFPDAISAAIDEERRQFFEERGRAFEGHFVLTLTWFPPARAQRRMTNWLVIDEAPEADARTQTLTIIEEFKQAVDQIENRLKIALEVRRLKAVPQEGSNPGDPLQDEFLSWLQTCITGVRQPILLPRNPVYLDALIGGQDFWTGLTPMIGDRYVQVVGIEGFPLESHPGILSALGELNLEYRWSTRFVFLDAHEAEAHLEKFRKKWRQKIRSLFDQVFRTSGGGAIDQNAVDMTADAEEAKAEVASGEVAAGYYTSVVVLMDEDRDRVEASARTVAQAIARLGFAARIESVNTMDAYFGSLPGHGVENLRKPLVNTMNLADMLPTSSIWTGEALAPCPLGGYRGAPPLMQVMTQGATPFRLNLHVRDVGHTFIFGPTGAGKSVHLAVLAAQLRRYPDMRIFAFDKGLSMFALTKAVGGLHFAPGADSGDQAEGREAGQDLTFCPLQFLDTRGDRAWALDWIETLLALNGVVVTVEHRNAIGLALASMHASGAKTISEFSLTVQNGEIREALEAYKIGGPMGHLLDGEEDGLRLSAFSTFEIEELMGLGEKYALPVLLYLFRRIERSLDGHPTVIFLDEAWLMLGHRVFRDKIREWFKVLRKQNCAVVLATQSLSDAANSGILDVILESTATKIFLPNLYARDDMSAALYRRMGLSARQIDIVAQAIPKRQYYAVSEQGRRLYELALGPLTLAFAGAGGAEAAAEIRALERQHGPAWVREWLASRDLDLNDYVTGRLADEAVLASPSVQLEEIG